MDNPFLEDMLKTYGGRYGEIKRDIEYNPIGIMTMAEAYEAMKDDVRDIRYRPTTNEIVFETGVYGPDPTFSYLPDVKTKAETMIKGQEAVIEAINKAMED